MKCLMPQCTNNAKTRGLCYNCYKSLVTLIKVGFTNWDQLEKDGYSLPPRPMGRPKGVKNGQYTCQQFVTDLELDDMPTRATNAEELLKEISVAFPGKTLSERQRNNIKERSGKDPVVIMQQLGMEII